MTYKPAVKRLATNCWLNVYFIICMTVVIVDCHSRHQNCKWTHMEYAFNQKVWKTQTSSVCEGSHEVEQVELGATGCFSSFRGQMVWKWSKRGHLRSLRFWEMCCSSPRTPVSQQRGRPQTVNTPQPHIMQPWDLFPENSTIIQILTQWSLTTLIRLG